MEGGGGGGGGAGSAFVGASFKAEASALSVPVVNCNAMGGASGASEALVF